MNTISEIKRRGDCFRLLAACFYEPDKKLFIEENVVENLAYLFQEICPEMAPALQELNRALYSIEQEKLSIDHAALFVGPFELLAPPYGSVYLENKRLVMGESTVNAARYYTEAGLEVDVKEPSDHIAIELEFMSSLCNKEVEAKSNEKLDEVTKLRDTQVLFFHNALRPWIPSFCQKIKNATDNVFYIHLAECLEHFIVACEDVYSEISAINI